MKKLIERVVYSGALTAAMLLVTQLPAEAGKLSNNHDDTLVRDLA
jgi:hypothetical protein